MVDFFDKLYSSVMDKNKFLTKFRIYSFLRFAIRTSANVIIPIYFLLTRKNPKYTLSATTKGRKCIVSLTSFPARINRVWIVIESLLRQEIKPDMIILWLSIEQFPTMDALPQNLIKLQKRGLILRLCNDNLGSHKKYYYAMKEFPNDYIITVDDDVIYSSKVLSFLLTLNKKFPFAVCCNHATYITVKNDEICPYINWQRVEGEHYPSFEIMAIGIGGILYPPISLAQDTFNDEVFRKTCFQADDIWLNVMARLCGTMVAKTSYDSFYLPIINYKNVTLASKNLNENLNDLQLNDVRNYFISKNKVDPFDALFK